MSGYRVLWRGEGCAVLKPLLTQWKQHLYALGLQLPGTQKASAGDVPLAVIWVWRSYLERSSHQSILPCLMNNFLLFIWDTVSISSLNCLFFPKQHTLNYLHLSTANLWATGSLLEPLLSLPVRNRGGSWLIEESFSITHQLSEMILWHCSPSVIRWRWQFWQHQIWRCRMHFLSHGLSLLKTGCRLQITT